MSKIPLLPAPRGSARRMEAPMIHGKAKMAITIPLLFIRVASHPPPRMAMTFTAPNGMLKRIVVNLSKPNDCTIKGPKVPIPPEGILVCVSNGSYN